MYTPVALHCNGEDFPFSFSSHLIFFKNWSRFLGWFLDWVDWNTRMNGILDGIPAFGLSILVFAVLLGSYIYSPACFIHTLDGWNCEANGGALYIYSYSFAW